MNEPVPAPVAHGGAPAGFLDLSANLNPLGTPPSVVAAVAAAGYGAYADLHPEPAIDRLAADSGVDRSRVVLTAGATEGLRLTIDRLLPPGGRMLVLGPTYGEYARLGYLRRASIHEVRAASPSFAPPVSEAVAAIRATKPDLIVVCDPNNPTGQSLTEADAAALLAAAGRAHVVVDESFAPFRSAASRFPLDDDRVVVVRSLTKVLAIPGIRVGFVVATETLAADLRRLQDPWAVGSHALAAAGAGGWGLTDSARSQTAAWRDGLVDGLRERGFEPGSSTTNFVLVGVRADTDGLLRDLAAQSIAIRACASFGLPGVVRIAVPDADGRARLLAALDRLGRRAA